MKTDEEILAESARCGKMYLDCVKDAITKARESEREKTRTETAKEIFEKLENAFETILGYDAKGEDVICWEKFVKIRDEILTNKKEAETKVKE